MAKETSPSDSSLLLHEVLEAEFVTLHGQLPPNSSVGLAVLLIRVCVMSSEVETSLDRILFLAKLRRYNFESRASQFILGLIFAAL
jgi:hypothetical protein